MGEKVQTRTSAIDCLTNAIILKHFAEAVDPPNADVDPPPPPPAHDDNAPDDDTPTEDNNAPAVDNAPATPDNAPAEDSALAADLPNDVPTSQTDNPTPASTDQRAESMQPDSIR